MERLHMLERHQQYHADPNEAKALGIFHVDVQHVQVVFELSIAYESWNGMLTDYFGLPS